MVLKVYEADHRFNLSLSHQRITRHSLLGSNTCFVFVRMLIRKLIALLVVQGLFALGLSTTAIYLSWTCYWLIHVYSIHPVNLVLQVISTVRFLWLEKDISLSSPCRKYISAMFTLKSCFCSGEEVQNFYLCLSVRSFIVAEASFIVIGPSFAASAAC